MSKGKRITLTIITLAVLIVTLCVPCFAVMGEATNTEISGRWRLRYSGNIGNFRIVSNSYAYRITDEMSHYRQGRGDMLHNFVPQCLPDIADENFLVYGLHFGSGELVRAQYSGSIGTRGFTDMYIAYVRSSYTSNEVLWSPCCIWIMDNGTLLDTLMVTIDYANTIFSNNLEYIDALSGTKVVWGKYDGSNAGFDTMNMLMKLWGTNAYGAGQSNQGLFVPIDDGSVEPTPDATFMDFIGAVFDVLASILSIEFFGWFSIGSIVAVSLALGLVLLFLKYFAGG